MSWPKHLEVDKRIIGLLSASTYESFPKALREAVSNAYDADATEVQIRIDFKSETMTIEDNGRGMTPDEFEHFLRIAGRRQSRHESRFGRRRIGQFGIGFLAVFPFCEQITVESTVAGSPRAFRASIPASRFMRQADADESVTGTPVDGAEYSDEGLRTSHYTQIHLRGLSYLTKRYFDAKPAADLSRTLTTAAWSPIRRLQWELSEVLPVPYPQHSPLGKALGARTPSMSVTLNGRPLLKNDVCTEVLQAAHEEIEGVTFAYAIGTPWQAIHPYEARGLEVRLNGVGVGRRTYFDLQVHGRTFSRLHWLAGDIDVYSGLAESITLDRDAFSTTEAYDAFRAFFQTQLRTLAGELESIDVSRRRINKLSQERPSTRVVDEFRREVDNLRRRGFEVREGPTGDGTPASVDIRHRLVHLDPQHPTASGRVPREPDFPAAMRIAGRDFEVRYELWEAASPLDRVCRVDHAKGEIVFNVAELPSGRYSSEDVKKLHLAIHLASKAHPGFDISTVVYSQLEQISEGAS